MAEIAAEWAGGRVREAEPAPALKVVPDAQPQGASDLFIWSMMLGGLAVWIGSLALVIWLLVR